MVAWLQNLRGSRMAKMFPFPLSLDYCFNDWIFLLFISNQKLFRFGLRYLSLVHFICIIWILSWAWYNRQKQNKTNLKSFDSWSNWQGKEYQPGPIPVRASKPLPDADVTAANILSLSLLSAAALDRTYWAANWCLGSILMCSMCVKSPAKTTGYLKCRLFFPEKQHKLQAQQR